ncbi:hypothetical protein DPSP01_000310 [Paraphaeosphaeria sporulosa]
MVKPHSYSIVRLPKSHDHPQTWQVLIAKQKTLRLQSLLTSPEAFGSTYERESTFTDAEWEARLKNPIAHTLIAVDSNAPHAVHKPNDDDQDAGTDDDDLYGAWVGSVVLIGPTEGDGMLIATYDINALFILPEARGTGLGAELVESAVSEAQKLARGAMRVVVRALVVRGNERVLKLYERAGFVNRGVEFVGGQLEEAWVLVRDMGGNAG